MKKFKLIAPFKPTGDQPKAIEDLIKAINTGKKVSVLLGVTGSGKTFTMASLIEKLQRPTLVIAHNKTLAAQLFGEFKNFFPENCVEYFVSYYDYYQPEAYIPTTDTYIEKEATINEEIDRLRLRATKALRERRDVIIVASVSCIYGLGEPETYYNMTITIKKNEIIDRQKLLRRLVDLLYTRTTTFLERGRFRVLGDSLEIYPSYEDQIIRIEFFDEEVEKITILDPVTGEILEELDEITIYPRTHYATPKEKIENAIKMIREDLENRYKELVEKGKLLEAERLLQRTQYDIEMLSETGYCNGIENYSRYLTMRNVGEPPPTLIEYLPTDAIIFIDESHMTIPQLFGMYRGDRSRKETLVEYGFRLPSALDNRPLKFEEFYALSPQIVCISATPGEWELKESGMVDAEQVVRPTGLIDPEIEIRPAKNQVEDLYKECREITKKNERILVTTLTKKMAEDLTKYFKDLGLKAEYLHSDIDTLERVKILKKLRKGEIEVLIGVNLLREGLDLPEVSRVAILDADKEGFLRSKNALIQTMGRCARNINGKAILYADKITKAMEEAINETERRRKKQLEYNKKNKITPKTIKKDIESIFSSIFEKDYIDLEKVVEEKSNYSFEDLIAEIKKTEEEMLKAASLMKYEEAAKLRDKLKNLRKLLFE